MFKLRSFINGLLFCYSIAIQAMPPSHPLSSQAALKKAMLNLYQAQRITFLCKQPFSAEGKISSKPCSRCAKIESNIQWLPIVSHQELAKPLNCFTQKICMNKQGKTFKGIRCCFEHDKQFKKAMLDLHNFVPEVGYIKHKRRHFSFNQIPNVTENPKQCELIVDAKRHIIHTPVALRGVVARAYLYMRDTYFLPLSEKDLALYHDWHWQHPPTDWEKRKNEIIFTIQGNKNPYV